MRWGTGGQRQAAEKDGASIDKVVTQSFRVSHVYDRKRLCPQPIKTLSQTQ